MWRDKNVPFRNKILLANPFSFLLLVCIFTMKCCNSQTHFITFSSNSNLTVKRVFKRKHAVGYNHQQTCLVLPSWVWLAHLALCLRPFCPPRHWSADEGFCHLSVQEVISLCFCLWTSLRTDVWTALSLHVLSRLHLLPLLTESERFPLPPFAVCAESSSFF